MNNGNNVIMGSPKHYNYPSDDLVSAYNNNGTAENPDKRKAVTLKSYYNATTEQTVEAAGATKVPLADHLRV